MSSQVEPGRLHQLAGPGSGAVYVLAETPSILGRSLDCELHIRDLTVSRRHAQITFNTDGEMVIEDLGSGNGTFVNDQQVTMKVLNDGDVVRICSATFRFEAAKKPAETKVRMLERSESKTEIVGTVSADIPILKAESAGGESLKDIRILAARLKTLTSLSEAVSSTLDIDELLKEILKRIFDVYESARRAVILLADDSPTGLSPRAFRFREPDEVRALELSKTIIHEVRTKKHAVLSHNAMEDQRFKEGNSVVSLGLQAVMAAPLIHRGEVLGVVYVDSPGIAAFEQDDLELFTSMCFQCAFALGSARLHEEVLKRERLQQDLRLAERIQQSFLPRRIPVVTGLSFAARYEPAFEVGGDFYDFIELGADRLGVVVGDVSGKGVSAALYMARLTRDVRYLALAESDPGRMLAWLNRAVLESGQDDIFVTLLFASVNTVTKEVTLANAGHMPALVRHSDGRVDIFERSGLPLGVTTDPEYTSETVQLKPGDTMLLYSDGLVEAMSPKREMFGMDRLMDLIRQADAGVDDLIERASSACRAHVQSAPQFDDTTLVCLGVDEHQRVGSGALSESKPQNETATTTDLSVLDELLKVRRVRSD